MRNLYEQSMIAALKNLYYWMEKVNKALADGDTCFLESNFALQYAHKIDFYKELYKEEYEKSNWLELVREARKQANKELENE